MPITYGLYPNKMLKGKNVYRALIKNRHNYSFDEIVERMVRRASGLNSSQAKGILELFTEEVSAILEDGGTVTTPVFKAQCSISGRFEGANDTFSGNRHQIRVNLTPGSLLKKMADRATPRKAEPGYPKPLVSLFTDMSTSGKNSVVTPGGPAMISGTRLQFDPGDPEQGVFFVDESRQCFRAAPVLHNTFSKLILTVPADLPAGTCQLQVKSKLNTQTVRTGELGQALVVKA